MPDLRTLKDALFIARRDLVYTLRQRETLLWTFVMPVVFFYFIGTVTGGMGGPGTSADEPDPLVLRSPGDAGFLVAELTLRLEKQNYRVVPADSLAPDARPVRALMIPAPPPDSLSFTEAVLSGRQQTLVLRRDEAGLPDRFDRMRVSRAVYGVLADLAVLAADSVQPSPGEFRRLEDRERPLGLRVEQAGRRVEVPTGFAQAVPGTLVMFTMLVLLTSGAITLVVERERGLLRRLAATPISRTSVVLGKWTARLGLGVVQIAFAMLAGTVLFSMDWGGAVGVVALVLLAWAAFNASLALVLAGLARTEDQVSGVGVLVTLVLAALGGAWWPIEITPEWMQTLSLAVPTGWTMDAMHRLVSFGYGPGSVAWHLTALVAGSLILGGVAVRSFRYR